MHEYQEEKVGGGRNWEIGIDTYTLLIVASVVAYRSVVSNSLKPQAHQASLSFILVEIIYCYCNKIVAHSYARP